MPRVRRERIGRGVDRVTEALRAFWAGQGGEHDALTALAESRLLVPVVAESRYG